ncbi:MAG: phosphoenolpyruvate synthase [Rhodospirillales bacterium]|nr:phosphoenolpyruvate synthase [Rhodospirillales bacterium]
MAEFVLWLENLGSKDVGRVGGKNASLGEMIARLREAGIRVPDGFATTSEAYWHLLDQAGLRPRIGEALARLDRAPDALAVVGADIRRMILEAHLPERLADAIRQAYRRLCERAGRPELDVAVRSSATAEDLPEASFAGQQETFLNIRGEAALLDACRRCYASLFTDRAIAYRRNHGFDHMQVALSVGVQRMVRSDKAGAGVMFSIDTETGFPRAVLINAAWGLGESVVQGSVDPDEYLVFKPLLDRRHLRPIIERRIGGKARKIVYAEGDPPTRTVDCAPAERAALVLSDDEIVSLARWAVVIEEHYGKPMDMEWAKDGDSGELYIVQARPETVQARREAAAYKTYSLERRGRRLVAGLAIGDAIATGKVCRLESAEEIDRFRPGGILVTGMTDPDWVPIMKKAAAIVTDHGGRTSHAAIVSRELGLPAVVGCGDATTALRDGQEATVSCAEGDEGFVYDGILEVTVREMSLEDVPQTRTQVMLNLANPAAAFRWWRLPADGVGLARLEFVIGNLIKIHPMALAHFDRVEDQEARRRIEELTAGFADKPEYFVDTLARGVARLAAAWHPRPVIVRMSDFKTNEYARLLGGRAFEPHEENPMIGWRGASRYYHEGYRDGFALECRAIKRAREVIGLDNIVVMIPFCRTLDEADRVMATMAEHGLERGRNGLEVYVMCEIPSNVILAREFADRFDGFSIGSNDLTQLVLGIDRDSDILAALFSERDPAVQRAIRDVIGTANAVGRKIGLCGQAPSDDPEFARFLVDCGITSISVSPDSFLAVKRNVGEAEAAGGP